MGQRDVVWVPVVRAVGQCPVLSRPRVFALVALSLGLEQAQHSTLSAREELQRGTTGPGESTLYA